MGIAVDGWDQVTPDELPHVVGMRTYASTDMHCVTMNNLYLTLRNDARIQ